MDIFTSSLLTIKPWKQTQQAKDEAFEDTWVQITQQVASLPELKRESVLEQIQQVLQGYHTLIPIVGPDVKRNTRGRPSLKQKRNERNESGTTRDPSAWEMVEQNYAPKAKRGRPRKNPATTATTRTTKKKVEDDTSQEEEEYEGDGKDEGESEDEDAEGETDEEEGGLEGEMEKEVRPALNNPKGKKSATEPRVQSHSPSIDLIGPPQSTVKRKCCHCGNNAHDGGIWLCPKRTHVKVSE